MYGRQSLLLTYLSRKLDWTEIFPSCCLFGAHQSAYPIPIQHGSQLENSSVLWLAKLSSVPETKPNGCNLKVNFFLLGKVMCGICGLIFSICTYFECCNWNLLTRNRYPTTIGLSYLSLHPFLKIGTIIEKWPRANLFCLETAFNHNTF